MVRDRVRARRLGVAALLAAVLSAGVAAAAGTAPDPRRDLIAAGGAWPVRGTVVSFCLDVVTPAGGTAGLCGDGVVRLASRPAPVRAGAVLRLRFGAAPSDVIAGFQRDERSPGGGPALHPRPTTDPLRFTIAVPRSLPCGMRVLTVFARYAKPGGGTGDVSWALPLRSRRCRVSR